jgi:hypothetical protein
VGSHAPKAKVTGLKKWNTSDPMKGINIKLLQSTNT